MEFKDIIIVSPISRIHDYYTTDRVLANQAMNYFNVQIQRMTLYDSRILFNFKKSFLHRIYSLEIIICK